MSLFRRKETTGKWWIDHSLSLVLAAILLVHSTVTFVTAYYWSWVGDQESFGLPVTSIWSPEYLGWFWTEINLSVVAEPWGVLVVVLLSKWFFERGSDEDNDDAELKKKEGVDKEPETT